METGQETPTTMSRAILDVNQPNLGVGLDTANLILYGKANPVDAVDIIGAHVRSVHAKDGMWPTDPMKLGKEVLIGTGRVDILQVFSKLQKLGYQGAITIQRETSGPQQMEDVKHEKLYLEPSTFQGAFEFRIDQESLFMDRRKFVGAAAAASGILLLKPKTVFGYQANSAVRLALLGCGSRGTSVAESFLNNTAARVVAVADLFAG